MAYTAEERALGLVLLAASWRDTEAAGSLTIWAMPAGGSSHVISQLLLLPIIIVLAPRAVKDMYKGNYNYPSFTWCRDWPFGKVMRREPAAPAAPVAPFFGGAQTTPICRGESPPTPCFRRALLEGPSSEQYADMA